MKEKINNYYEKVVASLKDAYFRISVIDLENILSNAVKFTPEGGKISIFLDGETNLVIADTGIGIAPEDLPRVFEKGFTGNNGRMDKKATGIGLYLCRRVTNLLGHTISIASEPGVGTQVRLGLGRPQFDIE